MNAMTLQEAANGRWLNPPQACLFSQNRLQLTTAARTDFWQRTWYGFERHSGHAFGFDVTEDFTLQVRVEADFTTLYDQAGIFIGEDEQQWVKAGIEFNDERPAIGCVVTRQFSDWSTGLFPGDARNFWLRVTLRNEALRIQYSADGNVWPLLRLCHWPAAPSRFAGIMACTPERGGLEVTFSDFWLGPPVDKALHDLS